jgi:hypothetical protein
MNELVDHFAQLIVKNNIKPVVCNYNCRKQTRQINDHTINEFTTHLRYENWDSVCSSHVLDLKFYTFLNVFLRIFKANFPTNTQKKVFETN